MEVIIDGDTTPFLFEEKEEDRTCIVKNKNTGESFKGIIESINSSGKYLVRIIERVDKQ